jgi:DNA-binding CsgD family transcriptional regulator
VNYHLDHIFAKLGVRTRTQAVVTALAQGWAAHPSGR